MRLSRETKQEMAYGGILSLLVLGCLCIMMIQGLRINNMSLNDYREMDENNSRVVFSQN